MFRGFCFNWAVKFQVFKPLPLAIILGVVIGVGVLRLLSLPALFPDFNLVNRLEWGTYDWRMRALFNRQLPAATNLAAVFIDDDGLRYFNETYRYIWPLPRQVYGKVVRELMAQGARAVAFDILFAERHEARADTDVEVAGVGKLSSDEFFAYQLEQASNKVILAVMGESFKDLERPGNVIWRPIVPAPIFTNHAQLGHITSENDADGILRRLLVFKDDGSTNDLGRFWFMGLKLAAMELGLDLSRTIYEEDRLILRGTTGVERIIPIDERNSFPIVWTMPWNDQRLVKMPLEVVLAMDEARQHGKVDFPDYFKDKLVVVGSLGTGNNISDRGATPVNKETFLVSKHWNAANAIINNYLLKSCPLGLELALIGFMALIGAAITWAVRPWVSSLCVLGCVAVYVSAAQVLFIEYFFWLPIVTPCAASLISCHVATMSYRVVVEQQEKRRIKGIFSRVVAPDVVNELLQAERLALGGALRRVTIYFADVRGFTELTDSAQARADDHVSRHKLSGAEAQGYYDEQARELLATVNLYLGTVANTIIQHGGTLDKYIGDCVMAFWGAPTQNEQHAASCVKAAVASQLAIYNLNRQREIENRLIEAENQKRIAAGEPPEPLLNLLTLGSGINTGIVTVGLMGSEDKLCNYTVFGREVNLASRLEAVSGRGRIIVGEATFEDLKRFEPELAARCIAHSPVAVKGIRKLVQVYEVPWKPADYQPLAGVPEPVKTSYSTALATPDKTPEPGESAQASPPAAS